MSDLRSRAWGYRSLVSPHQGLGPSGRFAEKGGGALRLSLKYDRPHYLVTSLDLAPYRRLWLLIRLCMLEGFPAKESHFSLRDM